ncbi:MAG: hypothetical protein IVW54_15315 [Candidatus Binataceae bacterium]|nr:hypothetical protein [Candidatus Binataceae bacterium]
MARIVFAAAASHTAQMVRSVDVLDPLQRREIFEAWDRLRENLDEARPDALVIVSSEHFKSFHPNNMPAFCIGTGERTRSWGDGGVPKYEIPLHPEFSRYLLEGLIDSGIDLAYSRDLPLDHGFACPLHFLTPKMTLPVVPIFVNCYAPPLPTMPRCAFIGETLRKLIDRASGVERVAFIGTGGLSHFLPPPRFDQQTKDDDQRLREIADAGPGRVNEQFDHEVMDALGSGKITAITDRGTGWVEENGGNGGQEIRSWIIAAAVAGDRAARVITYHPVPRWLTGIGFMQWQC